MNKFKNKKVAIKLIIILTILIIICISIFIVISKFYNDNNQQNEINIIDNIDDYKLYENKTNYYISLFNKLKLELNKSNIDEKEYAKLISQLFLSDFLTLDNKLNKNDIGGVQFIYEPYQDDFKKIARDSLYHNIENNIYNNRDQQLPIVYSVDVVNVSQDKFEYLNKIDEKAYYIDLIIKYEKDLEYQKEANLVIIHNNDKLEIAQMK